MMTRAAQTHQAGCVFETPGLYHISYSIMGWIVAKLGRTVQKLLSDLQFEIVECYFFVFHINKICESKNF